MKAMHLTMVCAFWMALGTSAGAYADDDQAIAAFGQGVHAYFDGQYDIASEQLSKAIDAGTADPRPYFFRGIVHQRQGQPQMASGDFQKGAEVEVSFVGNSFDVDDSLERIQGPIRIEIEKYRREAAVRAKELRRQSNSAVDQEYYAKGREPGAPFDPRNLPDVSQIVDATVPFPEISAKPYFPPAKLTEDVPETRNDPAAANAQPQGPPVPAADDPFNTGNQPAKPANSKDMKDEGDKDQNPPPADEDPFGSDDKDQGAGDSNPNKDGAQEPDSKQGEGDKPDSKDDPFGGG